MWETIRGYLTFTRKERIGVLFLLLLISGLFLLPYFFRPSAGDPDPAAYKKLEAGIRKFESRVNDSSDYSDTHNRYKINGEYSTETGRPVKTYRGGLFYFDPNILPAKDWQRLGISEHLTQTVLHYLGRGGRFRKAEDLKKIYGLPLSDYERLLPYVRIAGRPENHPRSSENFTKTRYNRQSEKSTDSLFRTEYNQINQAGGFIRSTKQLVITDINAADSTAWCRLPGIGGKLASRIIRFREKLGGFYQIGQVEETFGLPDSTFQKIKACLILGTVSLQQIDLNRATWEILQAHPYIRWQIAREITEYRDQHGGFRSVGEILQLAQMDSAKYEKLKPYLTVKP